MVYRLVVFVLLFSAPIYANAVNLMPFPSLCEALLMPLTQIAQNVVIGKRPKAPSFESTLKLEDKMKFRMREVVYADSDPRIFNYALQIQARDQTPIGRIVYVHGRTDTALDWTELRDLAAHGYEIFAIEYKGNLGTPGTPRLKDLVEDVASGITYSIHDLPKLPTLVYAQSLGGLVTMNALQQLDCTTRAEVKGIILEGAPYDLSVAFRHAIRKYLPGPLTAPIRNALAAVVPRELNCPVVTANTPIVILQFDGDPIVPSTSAESWEASIPGPKWSIHRHGRSHVRGIKMREFEPIAIDLNFPVLAN